MNKKAVFRKMATLIWRESGDPSVYGFVELDVSEVKEKDMVLALVIDALNHTIIENPELNTMIKWGQIVQRKDSLISVMVNIPGPQNDLSLLNLPVGPGLTIESIKKNVLEKSQQIRAHKDPHLGPLLKIVRFLPKWMLKRFLGLYSFLIYELDTRLGIKFIPHKPFGAVIISNVGSLGIKKALLPLVPLARASMMISIGKASPEARVVDGEICIRDIVHLGITFDHRLFDGSHAAKMLTDFENFFYSEKKRS